ncbi:hypothetical protein Tco_0774776 [Tanacetum coccineum]|uniref:Uncharacterized protein n=1 Tax=Tanacetum coccineum TaxID=301880 RepID=A0ABQ4ZT05_9ASTR
MEITVVTLVEEQMSSWKVEAQSLLFSAYPDHLLSTRDKQASVLEYRIPKFVQNFMINHLIYLLLLMKKLYHSSMNSDTQEILRLYRNCSLITYINPGEHFQLSSIGAFPGKPLDLINLDCQELKFCRGCITARMWILLNYSGKTLHSRSKITSQRKACPILDSQRSSSITSSHKTTLIPKRDVNEDILNSTTYKTYYAYVNGAKEPKKARKFKKPASPKQNIVLVSPKEPTKKPGKAKKDVTSTKKTTTKPKPTKKKAPVKADGGKGLNVLSEVALFKASQLKEVTKRSKKDFHISHASGSGDGTDFESGVPDEQQRKISSTDEETEEDDDDDEDDTEDESDNDGNDDSDDSDGNDDDDDDDNNGNDDDDSDHERTESDRDENPNLNQSNEEHEEEEEEYVDEFTNKEDDADNAKEETEEELDNVEELYKDVNVNLRKEDVEITDADQGGVDQHNVSQESGFEQEEEDAHVTLTTVHDTQKIDGPMQSSSVSSDFTEKLLKFENVSPAHNEIASLMNTTVRHEEPSGQTSSLYTVLVTVIPEIMSAFNTTIPPPPPSFNPLLQQATPTPTQTASEVTTSFPTLPDFASVFRFNDRVTNLERDLLEMKQVDQYAQAISSIPAIVDRYIDNKLGEGIQQAIKSHTTECREEALTDKKEYIDLIDTSVRAIIKESTYEAAGSLSEFELTNILMDKIEEHKSYLRADYKRELYDALVKSYNTDKDLFHTYGEVFTLKRSRGDKDKDQDPSVGSDRGIKRRKSSKDVESSRDPKSKESKSIRSSKGTSRSQHKSSSKSAHADEPSHTVGDSGVQQNQELKHALTMMIKPDDEAASKVDWFK